MAKKRTVDVSAEVETLPENFRRKIPMTDVKQVSPAELRGNIKNKEYFGQESEQERQHLREDIRRRGIIVPLIAKRDGTLLAGHNRWLLAQELKLKYVPVQYVQEELTDEREREFIVKDNLLRRQLSAEKRMSLYQMLYPDFEETYLNPTTRSVGGRTKNTDSKRLTIARIAEETGQKENTVKKQIKDVRKKRGYQVPPLENKDRTVQQPSIVKAARQIAKDLAQATDKEKKEVLAIFRKVLNAKTI
jgi:ParB-like chromosome segregation protein Spo0J